MSCPTCSRPSEPQFRPFCSKRCKELDLLRWLNEDYRVPVVEEDPAEEEMIEGGPNNDPEEK